MRPGVRRSRGIDAMLSTSQYGPIRGLTNVHERDKTSTEVYQAPATQPTSAGLTLNETVKLACQLLTSQAAADVHIQVVERPPNEALDQLWKLVESNGLTLKCTEHEIILRPREFQTIVGIVRSDDHHPRIISLMHRAWVKLHSTPTTATSGPRPPSQSHGKCE
jgi:hypothetical protein